MNTTRNHSAYRAMAVTGMIKQLLIVAMAVGVWSGCEKERPAPPPKPIAKKTKPAAPVEDSASEAEAPGNSEDTSSGSGPPPPPDGNAQSSTSTLTEVERLNQALQDYYVRKGAAAPPVTGFGTLVSAGIIPGVPVAPPGMKYVIDKKLLAVRLEKQ